MRLGTIFADRKEDDSAMAQFREAGDLALQAGNPAQAAKALIKTTEICSRTKNASEAVLVLKSAMGQIEALEKSYEKAKELTVIGNLFRGVAGLETASTEMKAESLRMSHQVLQLAADIARPLENPLALAGALGSLGRVCEDQSRIEEALDYTRSAVFEAQKVQSNLHLYRWQWQAGRLLTAQNHLDAAIGAYRRAAYSLNILREDHSSNCHQQNRLSFQTDIAPLYFELADLLLKRSAGAVDSEGKQSDLSEARDAVEKLKTAELQDYFQDECISKFLSKTTDLDQIDPKTAVFYPILLSDRTELLVGIAGRIYQVTVPVDKERIIDEVHRFRNKLETPYSQVMRPARRLHGWLIAPIEETLSSHGIDTLIISPDSVLRTIPLSALHDGNHYLVEKYAIVTTPGLTLTDPRAMGRGKANLLLAGLTEAVQGFSPLPNVTQELQQLQSLYPCQVLQDNRFSTGNMEKTLRETAFNIVHIASHGQFDKNPNNTFLLTYDGRLSMADMERLMQYSRFRLEPVELLTLSACQTAAGDDRAALGLAGVALKAGARSTLATLWFVDDKATSKLVTEFYTRLKNPGLSKAQALREAQIELIGNPEFDHPLLWAPFLLIGNWL
jgi:CHAT domain-containing protein